MSTSRTWFYGTMLLGMMVIAPFAHAASVQIVPVPAGVGQEFPIAVRLVPESARLNAVEGSFTIPDGLTVVRISTGGSALSLWPTPPVFSPSTRSISFVGGIPGAVLSPTDSSLLFTIYVQASAAHAYTITPGTISGFSADGTGNRVSLTTTAVPVLVATAPVKGLTMPADHTAPATLSVELGSDAALFGGAPFVSFYGTDAGSGIVQYMAKEGWFGSYQTVEQYYVLQDSSVGSPVWIRATDAAGNVRTEHVPGTGTLQYYLVPIVVAILVLAAVLGLFFFFPRKRRRRRTHT